jgi:hypothetical protein
MFNWYVYSDLNSFGHDALFIDEQKHEGKNGALVIPMTPRAYELLSTICESFEMSNIRGLLFIPMGDYSLLFSCFEEKGYNLSIAPF